MFCLYTSLIYETGQKSDVSVLLLYKHALVMVFVARRDGGVGWDGRAVCICNVNIDHGTHFSLHRFTSLSPVTLFLCVFPFEINSSVVAARPCLP